MRTCVLSHENSLPARGYLLGSLNLPDSLDAVPALAVLPQHVAHASQPVTAASTCEVQGGRNCSPAWHMRQAIQAIEQS